MVLDVKWLFIFYFVNCKILYIVNSEIPRSKFREHLQALRSNNVTIMKSNVAEHIYLHHNYKGIGKSSQVIAFSNKGTSMISREEFYIYSGSEKDYRNILRHSTYTS